MVSPPRRVLAWLVLLGGFRGCLWYNRNAFPTFVQNPSFRTRSTNVADFSPFAGVRYRAASAELATLVAPPYDVIDDDQRAILEASDEHNSVRLILPRDELTEGDRYAPASATFARVVA